MKQSISLVIMILLIVLGLAAVLAGNTKTESSTEANEQPWTEVPNQTENKNNPNKTSSEYINEEYENELRMKKAEALRLKQLRDKKKLGAAAVKRALHANASDQCDITSHPVRLLQGKLCGAHYKVLQLDRFQDDLDKNTIKKAYRQLSLTVHPDKNPADDASNAFKVIQDAYECLSDDYCKKQYDTYLLQEEEKIQWQRAQLQEKVAEKAIDGLRHAHHYLTKASNFVLTSCYKVWDWAGDLTVPFYDTELPLGRILVSMIVMSQFKLSFPVIGIAILIAKVNEELLKNQRQHYQYYYSYY